MKDRTMATDPIDHDAVLKNFAPPEPVDESKLPLSSWAVVATILGVLALVAVFVHVGQFIAIVAIICGHAGRRDVKTNLKGGSGWASTGLWLGYLALALVVLDVVLS